MVEELGERSEIRVARRGVTHVAHESRGVREVPALAVAVVQPREDTEDLEVALHAHPLHIAPEGGEVRWNRQPGLACLLPVPDGPVQYAFLVPREERVAEEASNVVADRAEHGVLEV